MTHTFVLGLNRCLHCGVKGTHLAQGAWLYAGPSTCSAPKGPQCMCAAGCGGQFLCPCGCHVNAKASTAGQLILPFDWDLPGMGPEDRTPVMAPKCPDCGRDWVEVLDAYHGTDPEMAELCERCRSRRERQRGRP